VTVVHDVPPKKFQALRGGLYRFQPRGEYTGPLDCKHCSFGPDGCEATADCRGGYMVEVDKNSDEYLTARLKGEI